MASEKKTGSGFDPGTAGEEILKLMKSSFQASFDNVARIQDVNEKVLKETIQKGKSVQDDALKMVDEFIENARKGQQEYRRMMEEGFKKLEEMFTKGD